MNYDLDTPEGMANSIAWTEATFARIKDGGTWMVPRSMTILTIKHSEKRVIEQCQGLPDRAMRRVIEAMGWKYERA
jgi:hypothetical protein